MLTICADGDWFVCLNEHLKFGPTSNNNRTSDKGDKKSSQKRRGDAIFCVLNFQYWGNFWIVSSG